MKKILKKAKAIKAVKRKVAKPFTAKFEPSELTNKQVKVLELLASNGPLTLPEVGDVAFERERPAKKRCSWARNQFRNLRAHKLVTHKARQKDQPATYASTI